MARALAHQPPIYQPFPLLRKQKAAAAQGPANWHNRTLWTGNNLDILRGMNAASVDLLYLDPPFNNRFFGKGQGQAGQVRHGEGGAYLLQLCPCR